MQRSRGRSFLLTSSLFIALALLVVEGRCGPTARPTNEFVYTGGDCSPYLGKHIFILKDQHAAFNMAEVEGSSDFVPSTSDIPDLGLGPEAYWAKIDVWNASDHRKFFIHISQSEIDELDIYQAGPGSRPVHIVHAGSTRKLDLRTQPSSELAFPLNVPEDSRVTLFIRVKSNKPLRLPITMESPSGFSAGQQNRSLFVGGYLGIMLVMALYNLFLFCFTREKAYGTYVTYILSVGFTQMAFLGLLSYSIFRDLPWLSSHSPLYLTALTVAVAGEFMIGFIHVKDHYPRAVRAMRWFYLVLAIGVGMDLLGSHIAAYQLLQASAGIFAIVQLVVIASIAIKGSRPARYFLLAWIAFLLGIIVFILKDVGILPYNDLTRFAMTIGSTVEVALLSFGLADKINILRREKERSQAAALELAHENERIIVEQNVMLEGKVTERTRALQESNDHLKRTQSQLVNAEKMASLGQLTAGIAHEINNPLNFISSSIQPLKRDLFELKQVLDAYREARTSGQGLDQVAILEERIGVDFTVKEVQEILASMETGASRTSEIVRGLRTFSRLDEDDLKMANVNEGIRSTLVVLGPQLKHAVKVELDLPDMPQVECYPGKLNQVFMNILNNAVFAASKHHPNQGGTVSVSTRQDEQNIVIAITDNGMGMDETTKNRLFEPFFTTKDVGEGTGLGLSIAMSIMQDHQGSIQVASTPGAGCTFTLTLPVRQRQAKRA